MEQLTIKQRGDAAEHYVISMLGFNSIPAAKMPDNWPGYDLVAQPPDGAQPIRISVKFRTFSGDMTTTYFDYRPRDRFDFIALVLKQPTGVSVRTWIVPRAVADATTSPKKPDAKSKERWWTLKGLEKRCSAYENNFLLAVDTHATA
jgi:hypothetical protein